MQIPLTAAAYTAIFVLLGVVLTIRVILERVRTGINDGAADNAELAQAIRAHANFTEQAPFAILILLCADIVGTPQPLVFALGGVLLVTRIFSAIGLSRSLDQSFLRQAGAGLTQLTLGVASVAVLYMLLG